MTHPDPDADHVARAATWYVGAFAGLGSVLLAGTQLSSLDWNDARAPGLAVIAMGASVTAAITILVLATRVLVPHTTLLDLAKREDKRSKRLRTGDLSTLDPKERWAAIASRDWLLSKIYAYDMLEERPNDIQNEILDARPNGANPDGANLDKLLTKASLFTNAANRWRSRRSFLQLRWATVIAAPVVFTGTIMWSFFGSPDAPHPSAANPVPVTVTLVQSAQPGHVFGPGCSARHLAGVAVAGDIRSSAMIAFPPQDDCPGKILVVTERIGAITIAK